MLKTSSEADFFGTPTLKNSCMFSKDKNHSTYSHTFAACLISPIWRWQCHNPWWFWGSLSNCFQETSPVPWTSGRPRHRGISLKWMTIFWASSCLKIFATQCMSHVDMRWMLRVTPPKVGTFLSLKNDNWKTNPFRIWGPEIWKNHAKCWETSRNPAKSGKGCLSPILQIRNNCCVLLGRGITDSNIQYIICVYIHIYIQKYLFQLLPCWYFLKSNNRPSASPKDTSWLSRHPR